MDYKQLEDFLSRENAKLGEMGKKLCPNINNAYHPNVVPVKKSLSLDGHIISAHASFNIVNIEDDCDIPKQPMLFEWLYITPAITACVVSLINSAFLVWMCLRQRNAQILVQNNN